MEDPIQNLMGFYGKYQLYMTFITIAAKVSIAWNMLAIVFLGPKVTFTCNGVTGKCPCSNPVYDTSTFPVTIVTKWNLICERKWLVSLVQSTFMLGTLVGSILYGSFSDRYGRRIPLLVAIVIQIIAGVACAFVDNLWFFIFLRFNIGISIGGDMVITFVIIMEFIGANYREIISAVYQLPFNVGCMMMPLVAYCFRDYSHFSLALTIASFILLPYFILIPDTPRWFIAMRRVDDAVKIITKVATMNKLPTENIRSVVENYIQGLEKQTTVQASVLDVFRTPNLRRSLICMTMSWVSCAYCFYGVSQYIGQLAGNIFLNVFVSSTFSCIATLISIPLMRVLGRKPLLISMNLLAAFCLLILAMVPYPTIRIMLAIVGTMASFIVFVVVYLYTGELFPTVVRNACLGFCSMMGRVGSILAPFVIDTGELQAWLPPVLFAVLPCIAGGLAFLLPETKGRVLMTSLMEAEEFMNRH